MNSKKLFLACLLIMAGLSGALRAQLMVTDHEGEEYEYAQMADGRNWMLQNLRVTTNLQGEPLHVYWHPLNEAKTAGYATQEEAAYTTGFAYLREEFLGTFGQERPYSIRDRGLCPEGWHVPDFGNEMAEYNTVITNYGGLVGSWNTDAKWGPWKSAMRIAQSGYHLKKFDIDTDFSVKGGGGGGQHHLITTGQWGPGDITVMLNVGGPDMLWGGAETSAGYAGYCRCVENVQATATFDDFSAFGVMVTFSEPLRKNLYVSEKIIVAGAEVEVSEICPRNFLIKEVETDAIVPADAIYLSPDRKTVQIEAELDESKIYELVMVDARLRDAGKPYGGYTFNGGVKMYFPKVPSGLNVLKDLSVRINVSGNDLVIEQFGLSLDASIYDMAGVRRMALKNLQGIEHINIHSLSAGMYIVRLVDPVSQNSITKKFIVK
jgi:uncharacterized protein (TIGR02145 family)